MHNVTIKVKKKSRVQSRNGQLVTITDSDGFHVYGNAQSCLQMTSTGNTKSSTEYSFGANYN